MYVAACREKVVIALTIVFVCRNDKPEDDGRKGWTSDRLKDGDDDDDNTGSVDNEEAGSTCGGRSLLSAMPSVNSDKRATIEESIATGNHGELCARLSGRGGVPVGVVAAMSQDSVGFKDTTQRQRTNLKVAIGSRLRHLQHHADACVGHSRS